MSIVFMGTPDFAAESLRALIEAGHDVKLVITQPDREKNRGKKLIFSQVKELALSHGIPVLQPQRLRDDETVKKAIKDVEAELGVVVAYGQILSEDVLKSTRLGFVNVHGSLLPKLRGASPIQSAILQGMKITGITIMKVEKGLDSGAMLSKREVQIEDEAGNGKTSPELEAEMADAGASLLVETIGDIEKFMDNSQPQDEAEATFCSIIKKEDGFLDFSESAVEIERKCRAYNPWPTTFSNMGDKTYKFWKFQVVEGGCDSAEHGEVTSVSDDNFVIKCGEDSLKVLELQAPGKRRMNASDFLRGNSICVGDRFGV